VDDLPDDLLGRWRDAVAAGRQGTTGRPEPADGAAEAVGRELLARWAEPHRSYHGLDHLRAVLDVVDAHAATADDAAAVRLAAFVHDAVYDPRRDDNEARSAALAERVLPGIGVPPLRTAAVVRLVRLTAAHHPLPGDRDGALLCDADLAVLARDPEAYAAYAAGVRAEYAHVPEEAFRAGRAQVLRRLLGLPALYRVPALHEAWEQRARANLRAELAALTGVDGPELTGWTGPGLTGPARPG